MSRTVGILTCIAVLAGAAAIAMAKDPKTSAARTNASSHKSITEGVDCGNCHTPASWGMAGGKKGEGFDHSRTGFPLTGRHESAACTQCHGGEQRVTRECKNCHQSPHQSRLSSQCASCHSSRRWNDMEPFEIHRRTSHQRNGERQWTTVQTDCFSCHSSEYLDPNVHPSHRGTSTSPAFPQDCSQCHLASSWSPAFIDPTVSLTPATAAVSRSLGGMVVPREHDRYFPLMHGPHRGAPCNSCHTSSRAPRLVRCTGCHAHNPVKLRQQHARPVSSSGQACLGCHPGGVAR
jgi:hypothetical protein